MYDEIFQTCDDLRTLTINKNSIEKGSINLQKHLKKTSEARRKFLKEMIDSE